MNDSRPSRHRSTRGKQSAPSRPVEQRSATSAEEPDLSALDAAEREDRQAIARLSHLTERAYRQPVIAPESERYPPVRPTRQRTGTRRPSVPVRKKPRFRWGYNLLSLIFLLGSFGAGFWIYSIWEHPLGAWNPLPPPTPFIQVTATPNFAANLPTPDDAGQIIIVATETPGAVDPNNPFILGGPVAYEGNRNNFGCAWWSVAGSVTFADGNPAPGYRVRVTLSDTTETVFTGSAPRFGAGGFELPLPGQPRAATITVQLFSPSNEIRSEPITVSTQPACDANVAILNFVQAR